MHPVAEDDSLRISIGRRLAAKPPVVGYKKVLRVVTPIELTDGFYYKITGKAEIESDFEVDDKLSFLLTNPFSCRDKEGKFPIGPGIDSTSRMILAFDRSLLDDLVEEIDAKGRSYAKEIAHALINVHEAGWKESKGDHFKCVIHPEDVAGDCISTLYSVSILAKGGVWPYIGCGIPSLPRMWLELRALIEEKEYAKRIMENEKLKS
ncbi:MAG TPA: hypothetical protein EYP30_07400, partial [Archaeoglobaceae archaeon]|nr:hypothetical protein [Archaeoglobaceae archaeon]